MHAHMVDDGLIEELLTQQAAATLRAPRDPRRRWARLMVLAGLLPALVIGAVVWALAGPVAAVVAFVVVLALIGGGLGWLIWRPAEARVLVAIGGRPADPVSDARLLNLVEGLCTATGLRVPKVRVVEAPGLNALAAGRSASSATLAVTTGLVSELSRIELEGVLAEEVVAIRRERMVPATIAASVPPALSRFFAVPPAPEFDNDRAAVTLTRYPPGLIGALEKMHRRGTTVEASPSLDALWLAPPRPAPDPGSARASLTARIEALSHF